jgi:hypothetical protein
MSPDEEALKGRLADWFAERLPSEWLSGPAEIEFDREEALVVVSLAPDMDAGSFREETRAQRIQLAQQAEEAFGLKISWGTSQNGRRRLFTTVRALVGVPLALPERHVLDNLVAAGVAGDRSEAVAWCIRLVGEHESDWLRDLADAVAAAPQPRRDRPVAI